MFEYQLFIMKFGGYQLNYSKNWKGFLMCCWFFINWISLAIGAFCAFYALTESFSDIKSSTVSLTSALNWTMSLIRITVLFAKKERLRTLSEDIENYRDDQVGNTTEKSLKKGKEKSEWYSKLVIRLISISMFNFILKSLYQLLIMKYRFLPNRIS
jgi:hypothetical protein